VTRRTPRPSFREWRLFPLPALALLLVAMPARGAVAVGDSIRYATAVTTINHVGITLTNYGFFGNNFISRAPSFEYPLGSGLEHMSRAGLWVGGLALADTGSFTGVSTAIVDDAQGSNAQAGTEFTPAGTAILERSRIANSRVYSPLAVSDQDLSCTYSDRPEHGPGTNQSERHAPLGILIRQRTLGFSLPAAEDFLVAQFTVINQGPPLRDVYVGLYAQLASGDKLAYPTWPPSGVGGGPGSWYYKAHAEYDAERHLYKEHFCVSAPYPTNCNLDAVPEWAAVQLLAVHPDTIANKTVSLNWWSYTPNDVSRDEDVERYAILENGVISDPTACLPGGTCSPIMVLSVGPFAQINPGDSVRVDFAFVGGGDEAALLTHASYAQFASDIGYELPSPPPSPRLHVVAGERRLDLYWDDSPEGVEDPTSPAPGHQDFEGYRVYLGSDRLNPLRVAQFDRMDTTGFNTGFAAAGLATPLVVDGITYRYHYAVTGLKDGFNYFGGVTSYDIGDRQTESLESGLGQNRFQAVPLPAPGDRVGGGKVTVFPNPYRVEAAWDQGRLVRDHYLWFANLPQRCVLRIFTLSGDLVFETRFDGASYRGEGTRGLYDPRRNLDTPPPNLSGASYAWDLVTSRGQAAATGLYLYSVEDLASGGLSRGKFLLVKSDREN
jgi:hypothetical protein